MHCVDSFMPINVKRLGKERYHFRIIANCRFSLRRLFKSACIFLMGGYRWSVKIHFEDQFERKLHIDARFNYRTTDRGFSFPEKSAVSVLICKNTHTHTRARARTHARNVYTYIYLRYVNKYMYIHCDIY